MNEHVMRGGMYLKPAASTTPFSVNNDREHKHNLRKVCRLF